jgi:hypothetical protein
MNNRMSPSIMKPLLLTAALWTCAGGFGALAEGTPRIQFEQTIYDFGKTSQVATVAGVFKFKNAGDAVLKLEPPRPSCGCTVAELKPDTLPPGAAGELPFILNLGLQRTVLEKHIAIRSNDPQTPEVSLTIKADYTPLYEVDPLTLAPRLAFGVNAAELFTTVARTDGKPLQVARLDTSKPWITATMVPGAEAEGAVARIRVAIQRYGPPRHFSEYIHVYAAGQTNTPVSSIYVYGQMMGEVSLEPEALYWSVSAASKTPAQSPEALVTRRVSIGTISGQPMQLMNALSTIKEIKVELVPKEAGRLYELVARLEEVPASTVSGSVSFETSVAAQPRIEVPVIINVFKP